MAEDDSSYQCIFCYEPFKKPVATPCGHVFCYSCIHHWLSSNHKCPICSSQIKEEELRAVDIDGDVADFENPPETPTKDFLYTLIDNFRFFLRIHPDFLPCCFWIFVLIIIYFVH